MNAHRPYLPLLLLVSGTLVVATVIINWIVDPFRYFHRPWLDVGYSSNQRYQNPGIVRTEEYETVLVGTSHTEPFPASEIGRAYDGTALNLSASGSLIEEQFLIAELALKEGKVKNLLWEINYPSFSFGDGVSDPNTFPYFLYRPGTETPFRYLLSWDTLLESLRAVGGQRSSSPDDLHRWDMTSDFSEEQVLKHWEFMTARWNDDLREFLVHHVINKEELAALINKYVFSLVRQYPDVNFEFLLLPATQLAFSNELQVNQDRLSKRLQLRNELAIATELFDNVRIHDFQNVHEMTADFRAYKDIYHFGHRIVTPILDSLATGKHVASCSEVKLSTIEISKNVVHFTETFCEESPQQCQAVLLENLEKFKSFEHTDSDCT